MSDVGHNAESDAHGFEPSWTGMVCDRMVMRDGHGDQCGLPPEHSVHLPNECPMTTRDLTQCPHERCWRAGICQAVKR